MDAKEIRELIELISKSSFTSFELEREGFRIRLAREVAAAAAPPAAPLPSASAPAAPGPAAVAAPAAEQAAVAAAEGNGLIELNSPIVGTFYSSPSPEAPPFVQVGSRVLKGQVVCIVEAMKVMNEIEAEFEGEVVEVVVSNGQPVEYGETLFRLRPPS